MAISGYTNTVANSISRSYKTQSDRATQAAERISNGLRLNKASVDASSLAISEAIRAKVGVLNQALRNVNQGIATLNIAIGGMTNIQDTIVQMKALAAKANNDLNDANAFAAIDAEYQKLLSQIDDIADTTRSGANSLLKGGLGASINAASATGDPIDTTFVKMDYSLPVSNGSKLIVSWDGTNDVFTLEIDTDGDGTADAQGTVFNSGVIAADGEQTISFIGTTFQIKLSNTFATTAGDFDFQVDISGTANTNSLTLQTAETASDILTLEINKVDVAGLSLTGSSVDSKTNAAATDALLDTALGNIQSNISSLGAQQLQFESTVLNLNTLVQNNVATKAVYSEADVSEEITNLTQANVFAQLSTEMLTKTLKMQENLQRMVQ